MSEMDKEEAIEYLDRKDKIKGKRTFNQSEEKRIQKVMKEGRIYGDPVVMLRG